MLLQRTLSGFLAPHDNSHPSVTLVLGDLTPSSDLVGHAHMQAKHIGSNMMLGSSDSFGGPSTQFPKESQMEAYSWL